MLIGIDVRTNFYRKGGITRYAYNLIQNLARLDKDNEYIYLKSWKDNNFPVRESHKTKSLFTPPHHRFEHITLPLELYFAQLDIVHSIDCVPIFAKNVKSIITIHDLSFVRYPEFLTENAKRFYSRIFKDISKVRHIITDSRSTKDDIIEYLNINENKISVVTLGVDPVFRKSEDELMNNKIRTKFGIHNDYILFAGTIEPRKNLVRLLQAFAKASNILAGPLILVMAGEKGWLCDEVFNTVDRLKLADKVKFLGYVPDEELNLLYNAAKLFIYPSLYEGFGLPVIEAMACGTPVITSNTSSLPEVTDGAALLVNPCNIEEMSEAMHAVITNEELRKQLSNKGLKRAGEFNWQKTALKTVEIYNRLI